MKIFNTKIKTFDDWLTVLIFVSLGAFLIFSIALIAFLIAQWK